MKWLLLIIFILSCSTQQKSPTTETFSTSDQDKTSKNSATLEKTDCSFELKEYNTKYHGQKMHQCVYTNQNIRETIYCGCEFYPNNKIDYSTDCISFKRKNGSGNYSKKRSGLEWEHVVPQDYIKKSQGGKKATGDLHNLYPAVGTVNGIRDRSWHNELPGEDTYFYKCNFKMIRPKGTDGKTNRDWWQSEPRDKAKGPMARGWLYMEKKYGVHIPNTYRKQYVKWNDNYKPDNFECDRNKLIEKVQGNDNPYTTEKCNE